MEQLTAWLTGPESIEFRGGPVPQPGPGELLISVGAAVTCGTDVKVYRRGGHPKMLEVPSPFGNELAGTVKDLLLSDSTQLDAYLRPEFVSNLVELHTSEARNMSREIWSLMSLEVWLRSGKAGV